MAAKIEPMTEDQLGSLIDNEFSVAQGSPGGQISKERADAWDRYLQKPYGDEVDGESSVVSADVSDVVDGVMPSLLRLFTTADNLLSFDAVGPEDIEKAAQESDYVNYIFFKKNKAFLILYTWFMDALIKKNGIVKAWADEAEHVSQESYRGLTEPELLKLMDDEELEAVEQAERTEEMPGPDGVTSERVTVYDVKFRRITKYPCVKVANVPPEEYRISSDAKDVDPETARFVGQERDVPRSELIDMGFDKELVYDLPTVGNDSTSNAEKASRNDKSDDLPSTNDTDKSQQLVRVREGYIKVDFDGDGRSELRFVLKAGDKVLQNEIADRQPFHVITPQPLPHKHFGRATAEKVMDIQEINSTLERQVLTNLYHTNRPGHAVWEQGIGENTLDDLLVTRAGRIARFARPVSESYQPMTVPFTAQASFPMIEFFDKAKRDRTGVSSDSQGLSPDALKNIQMTVLAQATDIGKMKIEAIARIFAETGLKSLMLHIHELVMKHQNKKEIVQLRNKWVPVDPSEWRSRRDMTVNIGLGIGTREQNLLHLNAIKDMQLAMIQSGGQNLTVTPKNVFNVASEYVRNANMKNPEMFFTDPGEKLAAPPPDEQAQIQKQQQALDARQQQLDSERQTIAANKLMLAAQEQKLEASRAQFDAMQATAALRLDADELKRKKTKDHNDVMLALQGLQNDVLQMKLQYGHQEQPQA